MLNSKFVVALIAIVGVVFAVCRFGGPNTIIEKFVNVARQPAIQYGNCKHGASYKAQPYTLAQQSLAAPMYRAQNAVTQANSQQVAALQGANNTVANQLAVNPSGSFALSQAALPSTNAQQTVSAVAQGVARMDASRQPQDVQGVQGVIDQTMGAPMLAPATTTIGNLTGAQPSVEKYRSPGPRGCGTGPTEFYQVPGLIQKAPPPRHGASVAYGPNIAYNPPRNHMATKYDYPNMVKEGYNPGAVSHQACGSEMAATVPYLGGANVMTPSNYVNSEGDYMTALDKGKAGAGEQSKALSVIDNSLPVNSMEFVTPEGSTEAAIVCNNTVTAINRPTKRIALGCPIREISRSRRRAETGSLRRGVLMV